MTFVKLKKSYISSLHELDHSLTCERYSLWFYGSYNAEVALRSFLREKYNITLNFGLELGVCIKSEIKTIKFQSYRIFDTLLQLQCK